MQFQTKIAILAFLITTSICANATVIKQNNNSVLSPQTSFAQTAAKVDELLAKGEQQQALSLAAIQAQQHNENFQARMFYASLLVYLKKDMSAIKQLKQITNDFPSQAKPFFMLAVLNWQHKQHDLAINSMKKSIELDSSNLQAWLMLSQMYHNSEGHGLNVHKNSLNTLIEATQFYSKNSDLLYRIAATYEEENKPIQALEYFYKIYKLNNTNKKALVGLVVNHVKLNQLDEAQALINRTKNQNDARIIYAKGVVALAQNKLQSAIELLTQAEQKLPKEGHINYYLYQAYKENAQYEQALKSATKGLNKGIYPAEQQVLVNALAEHTDNALKITINKISNKGIEQPIGSLFMQDTAAGLIIKPMLTQLNTGEHGFHIHQVGSCDAIEQNGQMVAGGQAQGHYGQHHHHHGLPAGDLAPLTADENGKVNLAVWAPQLTLKEIRGRAVMIHALVENDASKRIACGIIK